MAVISGENNVRKSALPRANTRKDRKLTSTPIDPSTVIQQHSHADMVTVFDRPNLEASLPETPHKNVFPNKTTSGLRNMPLQKSKRVLSRSQSSPDEGPVWPMDPSHAQTVSITTGPTMVSPRLAIPAFNRSPTYPRNAQHRTQSYTEGNVSPRFNPHARPPPQVKMLPTTTYHGRNGVNTPRAAGGVTPRTGAGITPRGIPIKRVGIGFQGSPTRVPGRNAAISPPIPQLPMSAVHTPTRNTGAAPLSARRPHINQTCPPHTAVMHDLELTHPNVDAHPMSLTSQPSDKQQTHPNQNEQNQHVHSQVLPLQPAPVSPIVEELENLLQRVQSQLTEEKRAKHLAQERARKAETNYSTLLTTHQEVISDKDNLHHEVHELQQAHDGLTADFFESQDVLRQLSNQNNDKDEGLTMLHNQVMVLEQQLAQTLSGHSSPYMGQVLTSRSSSSSPNRTRLILPRPEIALQDGTRHQADQQHLNLDQNLQQVHSNHDQVQQNANAQSASTAFPAQSSVPPKVKRYIRASAGFLELAGDLDVLETQLIKRHEEGREMFLKLQEQTKRADDAIAARETMMMQKEDARGDRVLPCGGQRLRELWEEALGKHSPNSIALIDFSKFGVFFVDGVWIESKIGEDRALQLKSEDTDWMQPEVFFAKLHADAALRRARVAVASCSRGPSVQSSVTIQPPKASADRSSPSMPPSIAPSLIMRAPSSPFTQYSARTTSMSKSASVSQSRTSLPGMSVMLPVAHEDQQIHSRHLQNADKGSSSTGSAKEENISNIDMLRSEPAVVIYE